MIDQQTLEKLVPLYPQPKGDTGGMFRTDPVPGEPDVWMDYDAVTAVFRRDPEPSDGRYDWTAPTGKRPHLTDGVWHWDDDDGAAVVPDPFYLDK